MSGFKTDQEAFNFLQRLLNDVEDLKVIISEHPLSLEKRNTARERLIDLKDRLQQYINKYKTMSAQKKMTRAEAAIVFPAMQAAFVELKTKIGSYPNANWNDTLTGVAVILGRYLQQKKNE
jgi:hypothetical protein